MNQLLTTFAILLHASFVFANAPVVQTTYGAVSGVETSQDYVYRGIPYAAPPTASLRWQAPQSPARWTGVKPADTFSEMCPQLGLFDQKIEGSEDCLKLNIWRSKTASATPLPVMFFIHGGGNTVGSGSDEILGSPMYDGGPLSAEGVVVVTINYRLGTLGFMAHKSMQLANGQVGNYGVLDQLKALQFVHDNIRAFGGDPSNVTIFGESAGAINSLILIASPLSKGLYHRAIIESGFLSDLPVADAEKQGDLFAKEVGCTGADAATCLRSLSADAILNATQKLSTGQLATAGGTIDGVVLKQSVLATIQSGQHNRVPVIIGTNRDEFRTLAPALVNFGFLYTDENYFATLSQQFGDAKARKIQEQYPWWMYGTPRLALEEALNDSFAHCPTNKLAAAFARSNPASYRYVFTHTGLSPLLWALGAGHGLELPYVFGTMTGLQSLLEQDFSSHVRTYWTNFAKTANPNSGDLTAWPTAKAGAYLDLDLTSQPAKDFHAQNCAFWETL